MAWQSHTGVARLFLDASRPHSPPDRGPRNLCRSPSADPIPLLRSLQPLPCTSLNPEASSQRRSKTQRRMTTSALRPAAHAVPRPEPQDRHGVQQSRHASSITKPDGLSTSHGRKPIVMPTCTKKRAGIPEWTEIESPLSRPGSGIPSCGAPSPLSDLSLVSICNHGLDPMHICTKAPKFDLLALRRLDRERVRIHPLVRGNVHRLRRVRQDVEHRRLVDDRQERHRRHYLLQDRPDFCLDLALGLGRCPGGGGRSAFLHRTGHDQTRTAVSPPPRAVPRD